MKIEVDPADVDNQIKAIIDSSPGITSEGDLQKQLLLEGQTLDSFKARLKKQQLLRIFYGRVIAPRVKDLEKEVEQQKLINRANQNLTVVAVKKVLVLCKDGEKGCSEAEKKIDEASKDLEAGKSFDEVIKKHSQDSQFSTDKDHYTLADLRFPKLKKALSELKAGQHTQPIKLANALYIFRLEEKGQKKDPNFVNKIREKIFRKEFMSWLRERRSEVFIPSDFSKMFAKTKG